MSKQVKQKNNGRVEQYTVLCPWCKATHIYAGRKPHTAHMGSMVCTNCGYKGPATIQ